MNNGTAPSAAARLQALRRLLEREEASTQDELRGELENMGFEITQSTVSRDLRRVGAVKVLDPSGKTGYRLPGETVSMAPARARSLDEMITNISHNGAMVVINTTPGSASLIARQLDLTKPGNILGTIAGDDTVFVAPVSVKKIADTVKAINEALAY